MSPEAREQLPLAGQELFETVGDFDGADFQAVSDILDKAEEIRSECLEIMDLIELDICPGEDAPKWIDEGVLEVDGRKPSNPSGGLVTKGHPVGATGCAQIYEIVKQLRGESGKRQVKAPKAGFTHNGGGIIGIDASSMTLHVFRK